MKMKYARCEKEFILNHVSASANEAYTKEDADMLFFAGFDGLSLTIIDSGRIYQEYPTMTELLRLSGRISYAGNHPILNANAEMEGKVNIEMPAPAYLFSLIMEEKAWKAHYTTMQEVAMDISKAYNRLLSDLYKRGCRSVTFVDYSWLPLIDNKRLNDLIQSGIDVINYVGFTENSNNTFWGILPDGL